MARHRNDLTRRPWTAGELPAWEPGAHVDLHLAEPAVGRWYSLCSSPGERDRYQVAVLCEPQSRGGSSYVHDHLSPGDRIRTGAPRNHFPRDRRGRATPTVP